MVTIYGYKRCSTCMKAKKFLSENNKEVTFIDMVEDRLDKGTIRDVIAQSGEDIDSFFNTRGKKFKVLELKDKLPAMSDDEKLDVLASDGMLIKRPITVSSDAVVIGFNENTYRETFKL